jgi:hypothetical protein
MLTTDQIKAIFLECNNKDPDGMYADDVDILEFAKKLETFLGAESARREQAKCITFVRSLNVEVARALEDWIKWTNRSQ